MFGMDLCNKHRRQMKVYGRILERGIRDPNEFIINGDILEITLYNRQFVEVGRALVDVKHYDIVKQHKWCLHYRGYVYTKTNNKYMSLHRFITKAPIDKIVDHINHNKLDNREVNLRICTQTQNMMNTKCLGVSKCSKGSTWKATITKNGIRYHLGSYKSFEEARAARKKAEEKYFGEFRYREEYDNA